MAQRRGEGGLAKGKIRSGKKKAIKQWGGRRSWWGIDEDRCESCPTRPGRKEVVRVKGFAETTPAPEREEVQPDTEGSNGKGPKSNEKQHSAAWGRGKERGAWGYSVKWAERGKCD